MVAVVKTMKTIAQFHLPKHIKTENPKKQVQFVLKVINQYRGELVLLRKENSNYKQKLFHKDKKLKVLLESEKAHKKELKAVKTEIKKLESELQSKKKTNNRYRVALFDSGNFSNPEKKEKKPKGGQKGHKDTNRESREDITRYEKKHIYTNECGKCNTPLPRVGSTKQRKLIDIVLNPEIVKMLIESERQWCPYCEKEVRAKDDRSLPFTEYGINVVMIVLILRFRGKQSFGSISETMQHLFGLPLKKSPIKNLLDGAKKYLKHRYEELKQAVRKGKIMYNDETGWKIRGKRAWMWIMANEEQTVYVAAESRGKGIMEEMYGDSEALSMHDGYGAYINTIPEEKQLKCWAHVLRFGYEETYELDTKAQAIDIRNQLVEIYRMKDKKEDMELETFEDFVYTSLDEIVETKIEEDDESSKAIITRISKQQRGLARALTLTKDGTNNLSERELRGLVNLRKVSYGSDTYGGMETTAILASVIQSIHRDEKAEMILSLRKYIQQGIAIEQQKIVFDSS